MFEIGNSLRDARTRREIPFTQPEEATKVRARYLRALEEERFDQLPSETYVKGFLRTYAEYLGLDGQLYVDEFNSRFATGDELDGPPRRSMAPRERRSRRIERNIVVLALAAIAVVTVVIVGAWSRSGGDTKTPAHKTRVSATKTTSSAYFTIQGLTGPSFVVVRRSGPAGAILFSGTVEKHATEPFTGKSFWVNISSPENLSIHVGGKAVQLPADRPGVFTVTSSGWHAG